MGILTDAAHALVAPIIDSTNQEIDIMIRRKRNIAANWLLLLSLACFVAALFTPAALIGGIVFFGASVFVEMVL